MWPAPIGTARIQVPNGSLILKDINNICCILQVSRAVVLHFATAIKRMSGDSLEEIASFAVSAIKNHLMSFDEADFVLRDTLFEYYVSQQQFKDAGQILSGVNLESSTTAFSDHDKAEVCVKCAGNNHGPLKVISEDTMSYLLHSLIHVECAHDDLCLNYCHCRRCIRHLIRVFLIYS